MVDEKSSVAILDDVFREFIRASQKHGPMLSLHEAYAIILEEVDELWDEVKKKSSNRDPKAVRSELIQIAAMAVRAIYDLDLTYKK